MLSTTLTRLRKEQGLTQERLAELTGLERVSISHFENGSGNPTLRTLKKICDALGVTLSISSKHWIDGTSFVEPTHNILVVWVDENDNLALRFKYHGEEITIPGPEIGTNKRELAYYNIAGGWAVEDYLTAMEKRREFQSICQQEIEKHVHLLADAQGSSYGSHFIE